MDNLLLLALTAVGAFILIGAIAPAQVEPERIVIIVPEQRPTPGCGIAIFLLLALLLVLVLTPK